MVDRLERVAFRAKPGPLYFVHGLVDVRVWVTRVVVDTVVDDLVDREFLLEDLWVRAGFGVGRLPDCDSRSRPTPSSRFGREGKGLGSICAVP